MTEFILWECLPPEAQAKLRAMMPDNWLPPRAPAQIETLKEFDKIIKKWYKRTVGVCALNPF